MSAKFHWKAWIENGKKMWKLKGWEGVGTLWDVDSVFKRTGPRFYCAFGNPNDFIEVLGDERLRNFPTSISGNNCCRIKAGDVFTPEQRAILQEVFKKAGERLRKAEREKKAEAARKWGQEWQKVEAEVDKAMRSMFGMGIIERDCIVMAVDSKTEFTVTQGNKRKAVLKWKKDGENYRYDSVDGDVVKSTSWSGEPDCSVSIGPSGHLWIEIGCLGSRICRNGADQFLPYQRSMWNNMFFAAVSEYWRQLDEKENDKKAKEDEAWLAQGEQTFEV